MFFSQLGQSKPKIWNIESDDKKKTTKEKSKLPSVFEFHMYILLNTSIYNIKLKWLGIFLTSEKCKKKKGGTIGIKMGYDRNSHFSDEKYVIFQYRP